jgi:hypothetical protein
MVDIHKYMTHKIQLTIIQLQHREIPARMGWASVGQATQRKGPRKGTIINKLYQDQSPAVFFGDPHAVKSECARVFCVAHGRPIIGTVQGIGQSIITKPSTPMCGGQTEGVRRSEARGLVRLVLNFLISQHVDHQNTLYADCLKIV